MYVRCNSLFITLILLCLAVNPSQQKPQKRHPVYPGGGIYSGRAPARPCPTTSATVLAPPAPFRWPSNYSRPSTERSFHLKSTVGTYTLSNERILLDLVQRGVQSAKFLVNIGAGDACMKMELMHECDEANVLLDAKPTYGFSDRKKAVTGMQGLLFEPKDFWRDVLLDAYRNIVAVADFISPSNASTIFEQHHVPLVFDLLKVDTDNSDCDLIDSIFKAGYRPHILQAEYNPVYPPPLRYNLVFSPNTTGKLAPLSTVQLGSQCSLSYLSDVMREYSYVLLQVDLWDAWYVSSASFELLAQTGVSQYDDFTWFRNSIALDPQTAEIIRRTAFAPIQRLRPIRWIARVRDSPGNWPSSSLLQEACAFAILHGVPRTKNGRGSVPFLLYTCPDSNATQCLGRS